MAGLRPLKGRTNIFRPWFDPTQSLTWNVVHRVLQRGSVLYSEAELLLREELREPRLYFSILRAMADGCTRVSEIAARTGSRFEITPYLKNLEALDLVAYTAPLLGKQRRGVWTITDPYLRFWFRFVFPHLRQLEHGASADRLYREVVAPSLDHFVSKPAFEEICRTWVTVAGDQGTLDRIGEVGAWWGPIPQPSPDNPRHQSEAELDVVATRGTAMVLAGEAKCSREPLGFDVLNHLREVVTHVPGSDKDTQLVLFGRAFDPRLRTAAAAEGVKLIGVDELYA